MLVKSKLDLFRGLIVSAKYNQLLRIEEELDRTGLYAGRKISRG